MIIADVPEDYDGPIDKSILSKARSIREVHTPSELFRTGQYGFGYDGYGQSNFARVGGAVTNLDGMDRIIEQPYTTDDKMSNDDEESYKRAISTAQNDRMIK